MAEQETLSFESLPARIEDERSLEELLSRAHAPARRRPRAARRRYPGARRRREGRAYDRAHGEARGAGQARHRRGALFCAGQASGWNRGASRRSVRSAGPRSRGASLPEVRNIVYMAGKKFGTKDDPAFAWAMNTYVPASLRAVSQSRIVAFSTLCVYPFAPVVHHGWDESVARPAGRLCQLLRRARAGVRHGSGVGNAGAADPAELRHRHALRRAARHRNGGS